MREYLVPASDVLEECGTDAEHGLGVGAAQELFAPRRRRFRPCSQLRAIELRFCGSDTSLLGRVKILSPGDYRPCSHH